MPKTFHRVKRTSPKRDQNANYSRPLSNSDPGAPDTPILSSRQSVILALISGAIYLTVVGVVAKLTGPTVAIALLIILLVVIAVFGFLYGFNGFQTSTQSSRSLKRRKRSAQKYASSLADQSLHKPSHKKITRQTPVEFDDSVLPIVEAPPMITAHTQAAPAPEKLTAEVSNLASESAKLHYKTGLALLKENKLDQAIAALKKSVQFDPTSIQAYDKLGRAYLQNEEFDAAINAYRSAVELDPQSFRSYEGLGRALLKAKQIEEAITCLQKSLEINSGHQPSRNLLTKALAQKHRRNRTEQDE